MNVSVGNINNLGYANDTIADTTKILHRSIIEVTQIGSQKGMKIYLTRTEQTRVSGTVTQFEGKIRFGFGLTSFPCVVTDKPRGTKLWVHP